MTLYKVILIIIILILLFLFAYWFIYSKTSINAKGFTGGGFENGKVFAGNVLDFQLSDALLTNELLSSFKKVKNAIDGVSKVYNYILKFGMFTTQPLASNAERELFILLKDWDEGVRADADNLNPNTVQYPFAKYRKNVPILINILKRPQYNSYVKTFFDKFFRNHMSLYEWFIFAALFGFIKEDVKSIEFPNDDDKTLLDTCFNKCAYDYQVIRGGNGAVRSQTRYCILYTTWSSIQNERGGLWRPYISIIDGIENTFKEKMKPYTDWVSKGIDAKADPPNIQRLTNLTSEKLTPKPTYNGFICIPYFEKITLPADNNDKDFINFIDFIGNLVKVLYEENMCYGAFKLDYFGRITKYNVKDANGKYICANRKCFSISADEKAFNDVIEFNQTSSEIRNKMHQVIQNNKASINILSTGISLCSMLKEIGIAELDSFNASDESTWDENKLSGTFKRLFPNSQFFDELCAAIGAFHNFAVPQQQAQPIAQQQAQPKVPQQQQAQPKVPQQQAQPIAQQQAQPKVPQQQQAQPIAQQQAQPKVPQQQARRPARTPLPPPKIDIRPCNEVHPCVT